MTVYSHGITVAETDTGVRSIETVSTAVIGVVATAPNADAAAFPLDTPVKITDPAAWIAKAGAGGTLRHVLQAIADQTARAAIVVVRVAPGVAGNGQTAQQVTDANVVGTTVNGLKTGLQALVTAQARVGIKPRIIAAPGLDTLPVTTALVVVAKKLRAMAYAAAIGADDATCITYRAGFSARELMLITPDFRYFDPVAAATATSYATARAVGLRALLDTTQGFWKTISNVEVQGVTGMTRDIEFDIQDMATQAALLNAQQITTLVAMPGGGFRFWGSRTCAADTRFAFESATRTAQVLIDTIANGLAWAIDKPLRASLAKDIVEEINAELRALKRQGALIGGTARFDADANPADQLAAGKLAIGYDFTPVPPLENLLLSQTITDTYFADFAAAVNA